jgi:hypothetical protein
MSDQIEQPFADGNMSAVVRIGDEVRRELPLGWQASHAVLRHLEQAGFGNAPRLIRHDDQHEWLSFMPGQSLPADLPRHRTPGFIEQVGALVRRYHEAMATFEYDERLEWPPSISSDPEPDTICHNDIAPWNLVVDDAGAIAGLIDWDLVRPGKRIWDLAYAAWRFGVIGGDEPGLGSVGERADRIRWLLDGYGLPMTERSGFVATMRRREREGFDVVEILGAQGVRGYATLYEKGAHHWGLPARYWLDAHHHLLQRLIEP